MGARGRKSSADLAVVTHIDAPKLPSPPEHLSEDQAAEWRVVVASLPRDKLGRDHWPLIEGYCIHSVLQRRVNDLMVDAENDPEFSVKDYAKLQDMLEKATRTINSTAIRLGIAQSSSYERNKRGGKKGPPPWQV